MLKCLRQRSCARLEQSLVEDDVKVSTYSRTVNEMRFIENIEEDVITTEQLHYSNSAYIFWHLARWAEIVRRRLLGH